MTNSQWLIYFDAHYKKFEWFFNQYNFETEWKKLLSARDKEHINTMRTIMNKVWLELPSCKFNIRANPKGWAEFLDLLEE